MKKNDIERYKNHIVLSEIGIRGQEKIHAASVAVIGCGGLGNAIANNLTRAGIGTILLIDDDYVEVTNLHRQILFDEKDAQNKNLKVVAASDKLQRINSDVKVVPIVEKLSASNIEYLIKDMMVVVDGTDNLKTRFIINDACVKNSIPWIYGAVAGSEGITMNIVPGKTACLSCFMPNLSYNTIVKKDEPAGVLNSIVNLIAAIQSTETLKCVIGKNVRDTAVHIDVWYDTWTSITVDKSSSCSTCKKREFQFLEKQ